MCRHSVGQLCKDVLLYLTFIGILFTDKTTYALYDSLVPRLTGSSICLPCRRPGSIPGSGRSSGDGNGKPLQYSCLENSMDGEVWQATVQVAVARPGGAAKSRTGLSN